MGRGSVSADPGWAGEMVGGCNDRKLRVLRKFYRMLPREFMKKYISISLWLALVPRRSS